MKILPWSHSVKQFHRKIGERLHGKSPRIHLAADDQYTNPKRKRGLVVTLAYASS
jgi:hypothetical protein